MVITYKPVSVPKYAFAFCRYTIAIFIWLSFILRNPWILVFVGVIMLFSAILKIRRAPLIVLYSQTINRVWRSPQEILNESAMRFAHTLATVLSAICLLFLFVINEHIGWFLVLCFAVIKTISALGFCPASKLYECAGNTNCCAFAKNIKKVC